jgi:hypothetical protein
MRLRVPVIVLLLAFAGPAGSAVFRPPHVQQIAADPFVAADGSELDTTVEPDVAVDPADSATVVAVFQQGRFNANGGSVDPGFATSHDGGVTWTAGSLPGLTVATGGAFDRASDPAVAIGPDGTVYAQTLAFDVHDCRSAIAVQRSNDGGLTFQAPVLVQDDTSCSVFNDKNWIAADVFPGSPHHARLYSAWDRSNGTGQPVRVSHSDDGGATWSAPVDVSSAFFPGGLGVIPLVQPNGDLTLVYTTIGTATMNVVAQRSQDGGLTFGPPVTIAALQGTDPPGMRSGSELVSAAVDPEAGRTYVVWPDRRFRPDGLNDIVLVASPDGGASWGALQVVDTPGPAGARDRFTPHVAANGGVVLVVYGTRLAGGARVRMRYVASADDGVTFSRERGLGRTGNLAYAATANGLAFLGDYLGVAMSASGAHAVWCLPLRPRAGATSPMHQVTFGATFRPVAVP